MDLTVLPAPRGITFHGADGLRWDVEPLAPRVPAVVVIDFGIADRPDVEEILAACGESGALAVIAAPPDCSEAERFAEDSRIAGWVTTPIDPTALAVTLRAARRTEGLRRRLAIQHAESEQLLAIGLSLSAERDMTRLEELIVRSARELTNADSGSLFLVEERGDEPPVLRFAVAQTGGDAAKFLGATLPLSSDSISGYVALTGDVLRIEDVYDLPPDAPYHFNAGFDIANGYRTKSVLCVPLRNHRQHVVGVVQLINRKPRFDLKLESPSQTVAVVEPFAERDERVLRSLASQAGVAIDNESLLDSIEELFERFVHASVKAIEVRDRATLGHSERVARFTVAQADAINEIASGPYADIRFDEAALREMRYAALLHDFGKVAVPEYIFNKAKKLPDGKLAEIRLRFLLAIEQAPTKRDRDELYALLAAVEAANEPRIVDGELSELVPVPVGGRTYVDLGCRRPLLTESEHEYLAIPRGSLSSHERRTMEAHVTQSYLFLREIPWRKTPWKNVPEIAFGHHEHLDGSGYPRGLHAADIPLQVRMMTIADIFDALTAQDRPYKPAMSAQHALQILEAEFARKGKVDAVLLDLFATRRLWIVD